MKREACSARGRGLGLGLLGFLVLSALAVMGGAVDPDATAAARQVQDRFALLLGQGQARTVMAMHSSLAPEISFHPAVRIQVAQALAQLLRNDEALVILLETIRFLGENTRYSSQLVTTAHLAAARILLQSRSLEAAEKHLRIVVEKEPTTLDAQVLLVRVLAQSHNASYALDVAHWLAATHPDEWTVQRECGELALAAGQLAEAKTAMDRAVALNPNLDRKSVAKTYLQYAQVPWALQELRAHLSHAPGLDLDRVLAGEQGQFVQRISQLPLDEEALVLLAHCYTLTADPRAAQRLLQFVLNHLNPQSAPAHALLGRSLLGLQPRAPLSCGLHHDEAIYHFLQALYVLSRRGSQPRAAPGTAFELASITPSLQDLQALLLHCETELREADGWHHAAEEPLAECDASRPPCALTVANVQAARTAPVPAAPGPATPSPSSARSNPHDASPTPQAQLPAVAVNTTRLSLRVRRSLRITIVAWVLRQLRAIGLCRDSTRSGLCARMLAETRKIHEEVSVRPSTGAAAEVVAMYKAWSRRPVRAFSLVPAEAYTNLSRLVEDFVRPHKPLILHSLGAAVTVADVLALANSTAGHALVVAQVSPSPQLDALENCSTWGVSSEPDAPVLVRPATAVMALRDFVRLARHGLSEHLALHALPLQQYLGAALLDSLHLPFALQVNPFALPAGGLLHLDTTFSMGNRPSTTGVRCQEHEELLWVLGGRVEVLLLPPTAAAVLEYRRTVQAQWGHRFPGNFSRPEVSPPSALAWRSVAQLDAPPDAKQLRRADARRAILSPGDALLLPARWHVQLQLLPDPDWYLAASWRFEALPSESPACPH